MQENYATYRTFIESVCAEIGCSELGPVARMAFRNKMAKMMQGGTR